MKRILKVLFINLLIVTLSLFVIDKIIYKLYDVNSPYVDLNSNNNFKTNERLVKFEKIKSILKKSKNSKIYLNILIMMK